MLIEPQHITPRIHRHTLRVADAIRPNLCPRSRHVHKRIIRWNFALIGQPYDLALQLIQILGGSALIILPQANKQIAVAITYQTSTKMVSGRELWLLAKNGLKSLQVFEIVTQSPVAYRGARFAFAVGFSEA